MEQISNAQELNMVKSQVFTNKVTDKLVMQALENVRREDFVPDSYRGVACIDDDIPLGGGRHLMEPMIFARLLQLAQIKRTDKVLVIGAATGYPVAVIARIAERVIGLDSDNKMVALAQEKLKDLGAGNATMVSGDLQEGHGLLQPYDVIFINGAVETIPDAIVGQMKNNGRLVTVKVDENEPGYGVLCHRAAKGLSMNKEFQAFTKRLVEFDKPRKFNF